MATNRTPLNIVVVSADTALLHDASWLLSAVGYSVETTKDFDADAVWRRYSTADIVLFDGRALTGSYESNMSYESDKPVCWILLYDPHTTTELSSWFAAGGHDAMRAPISRGELLARVRASARYLEFERRLQRQSTQEAVPGLLSKHGLDRRLSKLSASPKSAGSERTLVLTSIDWYEGIHRRAGEIAGRRLVAAVARALQRAAGEGAIIAHLGDGTFATLYSGQGTKSVRGAVEQLRAEFGSRESQRDTIARPTLTFAIVPWQADVAPDQLLPLGLDVLTVAQQSGGDCIVEHGDFEAELSAWQREVTDGNPFADVVAQDIMEPFSAILQNDTDQSSMVQAIRRGQAPLCAYVDKSGCLVGVASGAGRLINSENVQCAGLASLPIAQPITIPSHATFPEIYEAFSSQGCSELVVVADRIPLGYVSCSGFLSLIEPIDTATFASDTKPDHGTKGLIVAALGAESYVN